MIYKLCNEFVLGSSPPTHMYDTMFSTETITFVKEEAVNWVISKDKVK